MNRPNQVKFWREAALGGTEMLRASYGTHKFPPHAHDEFALGVIERGAQAYLDGRGRRLVMPERTICVINPGSVHEGRPAMDGGWDYRMVYVPIEHLLNMAELDADGGSGALHFRQTVIDDAQTMRLLYEAHICSESPDVLALEKSSRMTTALFQLVQRHATMARHADATGSTPGAIKRAREYIDAHLVANPSLDDVSRVAGMSPFHFVRSFKQSVGVAPHAYLVQRRVDMAKHLLLKGLPLRQVAMKVGYYDQGHFTREFRRFFGAPPGRSLK